MSIKYRIVKIDGALNKRYAQVKPVLTDYLDEERIASNISSGSSFTPADVMGMITAICMEIEKGIKRGQYIRLKRLGTLIPVLSTRKPLNRVVVDGNGNEVVVDDSHLLEDDTFDSDGYDSESEYEYTKRSPDAPSNVYLKKLQFVWSNNLRINLMDTEFMRKKEFLNYETMTPEKRLSNIRSLVSRKNYILSKHVRRMNRCCDSTLQRDLKKLIDEGYIVKDSKGIYRKADAARD